MNKRALMTIVFFLGAGCGGATDGGEDPTPPPNTPPNTPPINCGAACADAGMNSNQQEATVTRCLGPSCPRGECGFNNDCAAYSGFDALDNAALCASATGAKEFCLKYEVPRSDGFVDIFEQAISCEQQTVIKRSCSAGCGYNYAPDDCVVCNEFDGCTFN